MTKCVIHKYLFENEEQTFEMPRFAVPLCVAKQYGKIAMWFERPVSPEIPVGKRTFIVIGTGWGCIERGNWLYVGSAVSDECVWHVYEVLTDQQKFTEES